MIERLQEEDVATNKCIGKHGADHVLAKVDNQPVRILTHCNTGSLATAGYGTALGTTELLKIERTHRNCPERFMMM